MVRNGWLLFLVLLCVAFLVSCGKNDINEMKNSELVKTEILDGGLYGRNEDG